MVPNRTLVLECCAHRVALGVFVRRRGRLRLEKTLAEAIGSDPAVGDPAARWREETASALQVLARRAKTSGSVVLVPPVHWTLTKFVKIPRVGPAQQDAIIGFEAAQHIPHALPDVVWGSVVAAESASERDMLLAAARLDLIDPLCASAEQAGFRVRAVIPAPLARLAGFELAVRSGGNDRGFLGIQVDFHSATLALVGSQRFALRTVSFGQGKTSGEGAAPETLATKAVREISRSLLHFERRNGMAAPPCILLGGDYAGIPGFPETLVAKFRVPVFAADLRGAVDFADRKCGEVEGGEGQKLIGLVGAAAAQLFPGHAAINLLPPRLREGETRRSRRRWLAAAAVLAMLAPVPALVHFETLGREAREKADAMESNLSPWRARDARIRATLRQIAETDELRAAIEDARARRSDWTGLLGALQERLRAVEDVWLDKLEPMPGQGNGLMKLSVSGRMLDRAHPLERANPGAVTRVKTLFSALAEEPFVSAIESERFDNRRPGILEFQFVLVVREPRRF